MVERKQLDIYKRQIGSAVFLSIVTCGIYLIYWQCLLIKNTRTMRHESSSCVGEVLCYFFVPFYALYWWYSRGKEFNMQGKRIGKDLRSNSKLLSILAFFGLYLVAVAIMQKDFNELPSSVCTGHWGSDDWKAWVYLSPAIILLLVFTVWPIINTVVMSFQEGYMMMVDLRKDVTWPIGFQNYIDVFDPAGGFLNSLKNTMVLCVLTVPLSTFLALLIAVALNSIKPLQKFYQTIFFLPYVTNSIAIGMVFASIFSLVGDPIQDNVSSYGIMNAGIQALGNLFGIENLWINWMNQGSDWELNILVTCIYIIWNALPFKIMILMGGLQSVNKQYYDAAKVDSTPRWRVFTRITVPLLSPMITYVVITGFIGGFKEYSSIVGLFGETMTVKGDTTPGGSMGTMVGFIYNALSAGNQGVAAAGALVLFAIIFVVTMINLQISKKNTHY